MDNKKYDVDFVKQFTDFPLLVRTDTLKRLKPEDIIEGYENQDISDGCGHRVLVHAACFCCQNSSQ